MKRGLNQDASEEDGNCSKRLATDNGVTRAEDAAQPKRAVGNVDNLSAKLQAVELQALKYEHKAALLEQKNETLYAQLEKVILQNRVLRAGLGARFLQTEPAPQVRKVTMDGSPSKSEGLAAKRFPWLTTKSFLLPQKVMERICKCICDDELFRLRGISLLFYTAYYEQVVKCTKFPNANAFEFQYQGAPFNALRALRLARHGRRFCNVEYMDANGEKMPSELIMAISKHSFPSLSVLSLEFREGSLSCLPGNPNLIAMRVSVILENDSDAVNETKFPNLRQLRALNKPEDAAVLIRPHPQIEYMELYCSVEWRGMQVGKRNFPKLKFLESEHPIPGMTRARLRKEKVELVGSS
jgi:hypothetical protein